MVATACAAAPTLLKAEEELAFNYRGAGYLRDAPLLARLRALPPTLEAVREFFSRELMPGDMRRVAVTNSHQTVSRRPAAAPAAPTPRPTASPLPTAMARLAALPPPAAARDVPAARAVPSAATRDMPAARAVPTQRGAAVVRQYVDAEGYNWELSSSRLRHGRLYIKRKLGLDSKWPYLGLLLFASRVTLTLVMM